MQQEYLLIELLQVNCSMPVRLKGELTLHKHECLHECLHIVFSISKSKRR